MFLQFLCLIWTEKHGRERDNSFDLGLLSRWESWTSAESSYTKQKDIKTTGATDTSRFIFKPSETRIKQVIQTAIILVAAYMATTLELPRPQSLLLDSG